jgi:uncharacterized membrane protein HdeD (DUF308 family)
MIGARAEPRETHSVSEIGTEEMTHLEAVEYNDHAVHLTRNSHMARKLGLTNRRAMVMGGLITACIGFSVLAIPGLELRAVGVLFGTQLIILGVLQIVAISESAVSFPIRWILASGGLFNLILAVALFQGRADSVFLLGLWIGFGCLLRGFTMAVSVTPSSVSHVFAYDDLLNAVIVSLGLLITAFPFSSLSQLTAVVGVALMATGLVETFCGARRQPQTLRSFE